VFGLRLGLHGLVHGLNLRSLGRQDVAGVLYGKTLQLDLAILLDLLQPDSRVRVGLKRNRNFVCGIPHPEGAGDDRADCRAGGAADQRAKKRGELADSAGNVFPLNIHVIHSGE
jgi:hypothetical protein